MSTLTNEPLAVGVREQRALGPLRDAIREALRRNRPVHADVPLLPQELQQLAVRLCRHDDANVAVLPARGHGVIFIPV